MEEIYLEYHFINFPVYFLDARLFSSYYEKYITEQHQLIWMKKEKFSF